ncbi:type II toxin-antitoxin system PemK/MazF family toxin [Chelatococcus sambhunathii]
MWKERPVLVVSPRNTLHGHCLVLPTSTDPQEGQSAEWAHRLSIKVDGHRQSWVVCNHLCTVSASRLAPARVIPRISAEEFDEVLAKVRKWLPALPVA